MKNAEKLTEKECIRYHRELWNWLAENPEKQKTDWPGFKNFHYGITSHCFACQYVANNSMVCYDSKNCLFVWRNPLGCMQDGAEFAIWDDYNDELLFNIVNKGSEEFRIVCEMKTKLARKIRDLPLRKEVYDE